MTELKVEKPTSFGTYDAQVRFYKVLLYGTSGSGKTVLASTFPKPLFIDMEGGMASIADKKPLRYPKDPKQVVSTLKELRKAYEVCKAALDAGDAPFETIVLDSVSEMQELVMLDVLGTFQANRIYDDQPTQTDYGKANRDTIKIIRSFLRLPAHIVFTNVIAPKEYEEDTAAPSFVGKQVGPVVSRLVDAIGYTFTLLGDNKEDVKFMVSFANTPEHVGKDRLGIGTKNKPNNYSAIFRKEQK